MRKFIVFALMVNIWLPLTAQRIFSKPSIDTGTFHRWQSVRMPRLSEDGKYASYVIVNEPIGKGTVILTSTSSGKSFRIAYDGGDVFFSHNSKYAVIATHEVIRLISLGSFKSTEIVNILSYKFDRGSSNDWLTYTLKDTPGILHLRNLSSDVELVYKDVADFWVSKDGASLVISTRDKISSVHDISLKWINLSSGQLTNIWTGPEFNGGALDKDGKRFCFIGASNLIFCYSAFNDILDTLDLSKSFVDTTKYALASVEGFNKDGSICFFNLVEKKSYIPKIDKGRAIVDVWSYTDTKLQSEQLSERNDNRTYKLIVDLRKNLFVQLEYPNWDIQYDESEFYASGNCLVRERLGDVGTSEDYWNVAGTTKYHLFSLSDGSNIELLNGRNVDVFLSPGGKYVVYYDPNEKNYFCYNIGTKGTMNITRLIETDWSPDIDQDTLTIRPFSNFHCKIAGWSKDDRKVYLNDQYDIWEVDPKGIEKPTNLTRGFGKLHKIVLRFLFESQVQEVGSGKPVFLSAFNRETKENGFFQLDAKGALIELSMGPYMYFAPENDRSKGMLPLHNWAYNSFLVQRMSAEESPNYFFTRDFRKFHAVSGVYPEKKYKWLISTLLTWRMPNGRDIQGILYKPEDFNPRRKYPIIFLIYNKKSHLLHEYFEPATSDDVINIPYFVSQGYLIFTPDMHDRIEKVGQSVMDVINSAVGHLKTFDFIDSTKMGINGFSFGGYKVFYILGRTNVFAAAVAGGGPTDLISWHGSIWDNGRGFSLNNTVENSGLGLGVPYWMDFERYLKNSPIYRIRYIETPLLMLNNRNDPSSTYLQGIELFNGLRRLGKKVWMLQYDRGGHGLFEYDDAIDFTIRMTQFFNYYLKDSPAPNWMMHGIPAKNKGTDMGLDIDSVRRELRAGLNF